MKPLAFTKYSEDEQRRRAREFLDEIRKRRTVREFCDRPVPREILEDCIAAAATAPSGANKQPWTFVLVTDPVLKSRIREAAEKEEHAFYHGRAPERWLRDLEPFGTDEHKPYLDIAPALIVVFAQKHGAPEADERHYYVQESVGIAVGFLIAALHHAGLATLTHTPSPMGFLAQVLERPANERAFVLLPVGYPADDAQVPDISKKPLSEVLILKEGGAS
ncbi:MAG: nitroreductase family protein [Vicinamibacterales bacterium]